MENASLEMALADINVIRGSFEIVEVLGDDKPSLDAQVWIVQDARERLIKHLNGCALMLPTELEHVFKHSAMLLITPGVRRGFIDSLMNVDVFSAAAHAKGVENPKRDLYKFTFSSGVLSLAISQMSGEQLYALFLTNIIENASVDDNYKSRAEFDHNVAAKLMALMYAVKVAMRVYQSDGWLDEGQDRPPPSEGMPDTGGNGPDPGGSPVPRAPLTPWLTGAAANEIPLEEEGDVEPLALGLRN